MFLTLEYLDDDLYLAGLLAAHNDGTDAPLASPSS